MDGPAADSVVRVRAVLDAWLSGQPLSALVAPNFRAEGQPFPFATLPNSSVEDRRAELQSRLSLTFGNLVAGADHRVMFDCIWEHTASSGGSAGLVWGVFELQNELVTRAWWLQSEADALRIAGLAGDGAHSPAPEIR